MKKKQHVEGELGMRAACNALQQSLWYVLPRELWDICQHMYNK